MDRLSKKIALRHLLLLTSFLFLNACGIQFQEAVLYDGQEVEPPAPRPATVSKAVEPVIFMEDATNFWTPDDSDCTIGSITTEAVHTGEYALKINWARDPASCEWAGFGIGWDDWAGKDLTDVFPYAAIEMYVRSQEGKMFSLPIVLTLEDYSGNMAWSYTSPTYFERYYIDEEWQKIQVPLTTFDLNEDGIDIGNIKQLMFELQDGGAIYLDDMSIVYYEPQQVVQYKPNEIAPDPQEYPIVLFDDAFINNHGWGIASDDCQNISLDTNVKSEGNQSIHAVWDQSVEDCYQVALGVSWNKWFPTDLTDVMEVAYIELDVRSASGELAKVPVKIGFEDYDRNTSFAQINGDFTEGGKITENWTRIRIPLAAVSGSANMGNVKQLLIRMEGSGDVYLDNIKLTMGN